MTPACWRPARSAYEALAAYPAAAPVAALGRGRLAARAGRHADAIAEFQRAIELFPEFGAAYYGLAQSLRALGRREEARAALEQHRVHGTRWPAIDDPLSARVALVRDDPRGHLFRGLRMAELGDLPGAIEAHETALARNPSLAQAHVNLISLYGRTGQWAQAEAHYKAVLAIGFNVDEAHYNYGVLLGLQRRWPEAAVAFRAAIEANPLHAMARNNLGQILEGERNLPEATAQYRQAVAADPRLRLARYNLGRMLLAVRQVEEAAAEFQKLREPQDAESPRYRIRAWRSPTCRPGGRTPACSWPWKPGSWPSASGSASWWRPSTATWQGSNESGRGWPSHWRRV